jgi:hypothetical protein
MLVGASFWYRHISHLLERRAFVWSGEAYHHSLAAISLMGLTASLYALQ